MLDEIYAEVETMMANALEALSRDLTGIRTGRATTSLLDGIRVDYYGSATPLNQLASITAPEPRLLMIKPYEQPLIGDIEKAILAANMGITLATWLIGLGLFRTVAVASVASAIILPLAMWVAKPSPTAIGIAIFIAIMAAHRHRSNFIQIPLEEPA